jgi:hypothetical protein
VAFCGVQLAFKLVRVSQDSGSLGSVESAGFEEIGRLFDNVLSEGHV